MSRMSLSCVAVTLLVARAAALRQLRAALPPLKAATLAPDAVAPAVASAPARRRRRATDNLRTGPTFIRHRASSGQRGAQVRALPQGRQAGVDARFRARVRVAAPRERVEAPRERVEASRERAAFPRAVASVIPYPPQAPRPRRPR